MTYSKHVSLIVLNQLNPNELNTSPPVPVPPQKISVKNKYTVATGWGEKNKMQKINILKACKDHQFGLVVKSKSLDPLQPGCNSTEMFIKATSVSSTMCFIYYTYILSMLQKKEQAHLALYPKSRSAFDRQIADQLDRHDVHRSEFQSMKNRCRYSYSPHYDQQSNPPH